MPRIDLKAIEPQTGSSYPPPYNLGTHKRETRRLAKHAGLTTFGVNHVTLPPGAWSSQRHWHEQEDEFLVVIAGDGWLVDDMGKTQLAPGDCVAFPKSDGNGHHIIGGENGCTFVVVGAGESSPCHYSDIDLLYDAAAGGYVHTDGTLY